MTAHTHMFRRASTRRGKPSLEAKGYLCPKCGESTNVTDSRQALARDGIRRRRRCPNPKCQYRFTTLENTVLVSQDKVDEAVRRLIRAVNEAASIVDELRGNTEPMRHD